MYSDKVNGSCLHKAYNDTHIANYTAECLWEQNGIMKTSTEGMKGVVDKVKPHVSCLTKCSCFDSKDRLPFEIGTQELPHQLGRCGLYYPGLYNYQLIEIKVNLAFSHNGNCLAHKK